MLQFQDTFFQPEIRDGFFVDATMKTVWAAELEVVQVIAEVCERHGLTWYAAFGTLLGAIRHEGFIPWDDDVDLMMLREDYMKLMEVLPQEMPEGFLLQSPFSEAGSAQYHSTLFNGDGISVEPEHLRQFHSCPFSVGVDIFPLDYLPRDEEKRKRQKLLFTMAGRVNQMARNLAGGFKLDQSEAGMTREQYIAELSEGMRQLEEFCNVKFDPAWMEQQDWRRIITEMWRLANEIAMQYGETESDGIVMYGDYISWESKVYPKEWFAEVYSATFEDFMLPIPNGYDEFLKTVYGDYMCKVKHGGMHDYPGYAKQLKQLRLMLKEKEVAGNAANSNESDMQWASKDDSMKDSGRNEHEKRKKQENIFPRNWRTMPAGRKVLLYEGGTTLYAEYGEQALQKLEYNLQLFRENQDKILLWWRPQAQMRTLLGLISEELVHRYDKILREYKECAWGICDETDDIERAVENCNAYYGDYCETEREALAKGVPVMIEQMV